MPKNNDIDSIDFALSAEFGTAYTLLPLSGKQALIRDVQDLWVTEKPHLPFAGDVVKVLAERIHPAPLVNYVACLR
jgi:hypothetical protein